MTLTANNVANGHVNIDRPDIINQQRSSMLFAHTATVGSGQRR